MKCQNGLLFGSFHLHKAHVGTGNRFTNGFGVSRISFIGFDVGLDVLRRYQFDLMSKLSQHACEVMTGSTGFHPDQAGFQLHNKGYKFISSQFFSQDSVAVVINTMKLKNVFCQVNTKSRYFHLDAPSIEFSHSHFGTSDAVKLERPSHYPCAQRSANLQ
ncbi:hypothetical protein D3C71_1407360 [compost metagenome]